MNSIPQGDSNVTIMIACATFVIAGLAALLFYPRYIDITNRTGVFVCLAALLTAAGIAVLRGMSVKTGVIEPDSDPSQTEEIFRMAIYAFLFVIAAVPFGAKLYLKLAEGRVTAAEKAPGITGLRAWLSPSNVLLAACIALLGRAAFHFPIVPVLGVCLALLMVYPLLNFSEEHSNPHTAGLAGNREHILQMLSEGRITAPESVALLNALGGSAVRHASPASAGRILVFVGAALVLLGFFLPWGSINLEEQFSDAARLSYPGILPHLQLPDGLNSQVAGGQEDFMMVNAMDVHYTGGDIRHGLGWLVLGLALGAAALPGLASRIDPHTQRALIFLALGVGAIIIAYVFSQNPREPGFGIVLVGLGYFCAFIGEWKATGFRAPSA